MRDPFDLHSVHVSVDFQRAKALSTISSGTVVLLVVWPCPVLPVVVWDPGWVP